jgi:hypothetical protein
MDQNLRFVENLIKGKIAEIIFDQMFRTTRQFDIIPFGYENTLPELAQYNEDLEVQKVLENIKHSPDFVLISRNKRQAFLVEVKYCYRHNKEAVLGFAEEVLSHHYDPSWVFVADYDGFYFDPANTIKRNNGDITKLEAGNWGITGDILINYLTLLNSYIRHG